MFGLETRSKSRDTAVICAATGRTWSYADLCEEVRLRRSLVGARARGLCLLFARNDPESLFWYLALIESSHAVALLSAGLSPELRRGLLDCYRPDFVVGVDPGAAYTVCGGSDLLFAHDIAASSSPHQDLCLLLPTSGTTGSPKFVRLSHQNLASNAEAIAAALRIDPTDRAVAHLPLHYSYGLSVINSHIQAGAAVMLTADSLLQAPFWTAIRKHGINSFSGVPYTYMMLRRLQLERLNSPALMRFTQAGGKLDDGTIAQMHEVIAARGGEFWIMYGATEATARIAILDAATIKVKWGSVGKALPGGALRVLDASGDESAAGVAGQVEYCGPNVMMGYAMERADLKKGDELQGRLQTGDRGYLDAQGFLYLLGRDKRDAKVFGLRVNLDDVEAMVLNCGPVAAVEGKDRIVIFCEIGEPNLLEEAKTRLAARLGISHHGFDFRSVARLPTLANGKIDYPTLARLA